MKKGVLILRVDGNGPEIRKYFVRKVGEEVVRRSGHTWRGIVPGTGYGIGKKGLINYHSKKEAEDMGWEIKTLEQVLYEENLKEILEEE